MHFYVSVLAVNLWCTHYIRNYYLSLHSGPSSGKIPRVGTEEQLPVGTVLAGELPREESTEAQTSREEREEKKLAVMAMSKKRRRLYNQIMRSRSKKAKQVEELKRRRKEYDERTRTAS